MNARRFGDTVLQEPTGPSVSSPACALSLLLLSPGEFSSSERPCIRGIEGLRGLRERMPDEFGVRVIWKADGDAACDLAASVFSASGEHVRAMRRRNVFLASEGLSRMFRTRSV